MPEEVYYSIVNELFFFQFFLHVLTNINDNLNTDNFRQQGVNIFEWAYSNLKDNEEL